MRATGMVRKLDSLGRVVIPKEIRKQMHLAEGRYVEIYTAEDGIFLKKYTGSNESFCEHCQFSQNCNNSHKEHAEKMAYCGYYAAIQEVQTLRKQYLDK